MPSSAAAFEETVSPLKEIGHVQATTAYCQAISDHAAKAVNLGLDNDRKIDGIVRMMRATDFDTSLLSKNRGLMELASQNASLTEQAKAAEKAAKALRVDAAKAPTPEEAAQLTAFADALDGALHRQRTIARDVGGIIAYIDAHPNMTQAERDEVVFNEEVAESNRFYFPVYTADERVVPLLSTYAQKGADDFVVRQTGIRHDEVTAAQLVEPVFGGC